MTAQTEFFCNICNPGADREHPTGYIRVPWRSVPSAWEVNVTYDDAPADVCPTCIPILNGEQQPPTTQRPDELPASALNGVTPGGWPAHASPFGATPDGFPRG